MFNQERLDKYETGNWHEYQDYMESRSYQLFKKTDTSLTGDTYYDLVYGDAIWEKDGVKTFRDFKCGGSKYNFPISRKSLKSFTPAGYYDFMNVVAGHHEFFLVPKSKVLELFDHGKWYIDEKSPNLIRFYYDDIKKLGE